MVSGTGTKINNFYRLCLIGIGLVAIIQCGGCAHQVVRIDSPPRSADRFEVDKDKYQDVLASFGPPYRIQRLSNGFRFEYRSLQSDEWNVTLQRNGLKGSYSFGGIEHNNWIFEFNDRGVLSAQNARSGYLSLGWGGLIGHSLIDEPFFGVRIYPTPRRREEDWGFDSLRSHQIVDPAMRRIDLQEFEDNGQTLQLLHQFSEREKRKIQGKNVRKNKR